MEIVRYASAGGIVFDGDKLLLLRKSALGEVVLPKGHIEPGETAERAALRETLEETGYTKLEVLADLGALQAQFPFKGDWYIRTEHYFVMRLIGPERGHVADYDDAEHDKATFEQLWVAPEEAELMMTYEPARSFVRRAVEWWNAQVNNRSGE
jgi:8-oxo-dGTP pyrophosphatase MutT (NUDIX family)